MVIFVGEFTRISLSANASPIGGQASAQRECCWVIKSTEAPITIPEMAATNRMLRSAVFICIFHDTNTQREIIAKLNSTYKFVGTILKLAMAF